MGRYSGKSQDCGKLAALIRGRLRNSHKRFTPDEKQLLRAVRDFLDTQTRRTDAPPRTKTRWILVWVGNYQAPVAVRWSKYGYYVAEDDGLIRGRRLDPAAITSWMEMPAISLPSVEFVAEGPAVLGLAGVQL